VSALLLAVLALVTPQQPTVSASVDRTEVLIGEIVTLTIRVEVVGTDPARIGDPILSGFEIRGSRDVTRVTMDGTTPRRTVTRELRLLATTPGVARVGPIRVRWGTQTVETTAVTVTVTAPSAARVTSVAPHLQGVLDTLRPTPVGDDVVVSVLALPDTVLLGGQLDLVTLAWFPRGVRTQLRTPPTLQPPDVQGVWSYQQTTNPGVAASRQVAGRWYDLYASHQVVFPLAAGAVRVGQATVTYIQPLSYSFLSRELQHEVQSESLSVTVKPQPLAGRPVAFSGAAGRDIAVSMTTPDSALPPGGAATVEVTVSGIGNVALWPEPEVAWPVAVRVYPAETQVETELQDGQIAGVKRFRYLVIADSAGVHLVSGVSYPYFDTGSRRYLVATTPGIRLVAPLGTVSAAPRPLPAPPFPREAPGLAARAVAEAPWLWVMALILPPLLVLGANVARRVPWARGAATSAEEREALALEALERELRAALEQRVGDAAQAEGTSLADALRAAGVEASLALHVTRVRDRLRFAVFGPQGVADRDELSAEVREVLRALAGETPGAERRQLVAALVLALCVLPIGHAGAQAPRPEDLYAARAFRAVADSFALRVTREPNVAAYWYGLGTAFYRLGEDGRARTAWIRAARLLPRREEIRRALELLPNDPLAGEIAPIAPVTPAEMLLGALGAWILGWVLVAPRRTRRLGLVAIVLALGLGAAAGYVRGRYRAPAAIVLTDDVPLRAAPFGSADVLRRVAAGDAVRVDEVRGPWFLVRRGDAAGWVRLGEIARL
jgi:BatD DUF11 like domain